MTVLLTGGAGYIGSHFIWHSFDKAPESIEKIIAVDVKMNSYIPSAVPFYNVDIGDKDTLEKIVVNHNVNAVIHLAASTSVGESLANPIAYYHNNFDKFRTLLDVVMANNIRNFVFASSAGIYSGIDSTQHESSEKLPRNAYASSKYMCELYLADMCRLNPKLDAKVLRFFNVCGADPKNRVGEIHSTHIMKKIARIIEGKDTSLTLNCCHGNSTRDGTAIRDYVHVMDVCEAIWNASYAISDGIKYYNCGTGQGMTTSELIQLAERMFNRPIYTIPDYHLVSEPPKLVANNNKLRHDLCWNPQYGIVQCLVDAVNWEKISP